MRDDIVGFSVFRDPEPMSLRELLGIDGRGSCRRHFFPFAFDTGGVSAGARGRVTSARTGATPRARGARARRGRGTIPRQGRGAQDRRRRGAQARRGRRR